MTFNRTDRGRQDGIYSALLFSVLIIPCLMYDYDDYLTDYSEHIGGEGNCGECGKILRVYPTIVNGMEVPPTKYPWMVVLALGENLSKHCGGAIISEKFILTAAHCVKRYNQGLANLRNRRKPYALQETPDYYSKDELQIFFQTGSSTMKMGPRIAQIIPHPAYQPQSTSVLNDIALIRLSTPISCGAYAMPICLPGPKMPRQAGIKMGISGWGRTLSEEEDAKGALRETRIMIQKSDVCREAVGFYPQSSICLSGEGKSSPCFGDSGGPAFYSMADKYYALGVASAHTSPSCDPNAPVVYTSVKHYIRWIEAVSGVRRTPIR